MDTEDKVIFGIVIAAIAAMFIMIGLAVHNDANMHKDFKQESSMVGYAQMVKFNGMDCVEYKVYKGGSLDCDWNSKEKSHDIQ